MKKEIDTRFFRAGVGTVIYNSQGEVASFERAKFPVGVWQFQQGGIDLGEAVNTTLWRELKEEIGLTTDDFQAVTEYPQWTVYQDAVSVADSDRSRLGQAHRWFFLHLKDEVEIDLSKATDQETANYRWVSFQSAIDSTEELKKHVYQELGKYFVEHILTKQKTA